MRYTFFILTLSILILSCEENNNKQKELELKERGLALKEKEFALNKKDTSKNNNIVIADSTASLSTEQLIFDIQNEFKRINSMNLSKKKFDFACKNDPAEGTATYYLDNDKVVKIAIDWGFAGDYSSTSEYYFKNGKLIFSYDVSIGGPANEPVKKAEERTYVNNDKTIKYMQNQKTISCTTCQFTESSKEYKILWAYSIKNVAAALCE